MVFHHIFQFLQYVISIETAVSSAKPRIPPLHLIENKLNMNGPNIVSWSTPCLMGIKLL